jgi:hypothetical protein
MSTADAKGSWNGAIRETRRQLVLEASQYLTAHDSERAQAVVQFKIQNRIVRFVVKLPQLADYAKRRDRRGFAFTDAKKEDMRAQDERQRWRALLLVIKAKLECVENGIATFEEEFLAHIVLPNDQDSAMKNPEATIQNLENRNAKLQSKLRVAMHRARIGNAYVAVDSWSVSVPRTNGFVWMTLRGTASDASVDRLSATSCCQALASVAFAGSDIIVRGKARFSCDAVKEYAVGQKIPEGWGITLYLWFPKKPSMVRPAGSAE